MEIAALSLLVAALVGYYAATPGVFGSKGTGDGWFAFHYLPALVVHQTLDMAPVSADDRPYFEKNARGQEINRNPIGTALALLPAYTLTLCAEVVARLLRPGAADLSGKPFDLNEVQFFWTGLTSLLAGILGLLVLHRFLRRHLSAGPALCGTAAAVLMTPIFWYLAVQPHYNHGLAFAAIALLIDRWDAWRAAPTPRRWLALGVIGGVAALIRSQEIVFLLLPGLDVLSGLVRSRRDLRRHLLCGLLLGVGALVALLPQIAVFTHYFGFLRRPTTVELMRPLEPALAEVLFSTRCGLFPWTPVVYLAVVGFTLGLRARGRRRLLVPLLLVLGADIYLVSASWVWYGAFGFGCRRLADCAPLFGLGAGLCLEEALRLRWPPVRRGVCALLALLLVLFAATNLLLADLQRRRILPSSGRQAMPAWRWVRMAGGPGWLARLLARGYPFVQPAGWLFAWRHNVHTTAWEGVVGNYALEREAHDLTAISGERWDLRSEFAADFVVEGLLPADADSAARGRPVARRVRLLLQPFAREPIRGFVAGELPRGRVGLWWDGQPLDWTRIGARLHFAVPEERVRAHRVSELVLELPEPPAGQPPRIEYIQLKSHTAWWQRDHTRR